MALHCPNCGKKLSKQTKFCNKCGANLAKVFEEDAAVVSGQTKAGDEVMVVSGEEGPTQVMTEGEATDDELTRVASAPKDLNDGQTVAISEASDTVAEGQTKAKPEAGVMDEGQTKAVPDVQEKQPTRKITATAIADSTEMLIDRIVKGMKEGKIVLFVGNDLDSQGTEIANTRTIRDHLSRQIGAAPSAQRLPNVAQAFQNKFGTQELVKTLRDLLDSPSASIPEIYRWIARLPINLMITTAYDNYLARALEAEGKRCHLVISDEDIPVNGYREPSLYRICGALDNPGSLVLTPSEFSRYWEDHPGIATAIRFYLTTFDIVFLGYALSTPSFEMIWASTYSSMEKHHRMGYLVNTDKDNLVFYIREDQENIRVIPLETQEFLTQLYKRLSQVHVVKPKEEERDQIRPARPYRFLDYYNPEDAAVFFGREKDIVTLTEHVLSRSLSILVGESGIGKTSLVRAGLIPALKREGYVTLYLRVTSDPVSVMRRELQTLLQITSHLPPEADLPSILMSPDLEFGEGLVVIIDQFEEFFITVGEHHREQFIHQVTDAVYSDRINARFLISIRDDYLAQLVDISRSGLKDIVRSEPMLLKGLTTSKARDAIVRPAKLFDMTYEEPLPDQLIADLSDPEDETILPVQLQIICNILYESAVGSGKMITLAQYQDMGGAEGILAQYLEDVLESKFADSDRDLAHKVLVGLVTSEGTKEPMAKKQIARQIDLPVLQVESLLSQLVEHRLVRRIGKGENDPEYELAHDYLAHTLVSTLSESEIQTRAMREILGREMSDWQRFRTPIGAEKLHKLSDDLSLHEHISGEETGLILWSTVQSGAERLYWTFRWWQAPLNYKNAALTFMFDHDEKLGSSEFEWLERFLLLAAQTFGTELTLDASVEWLVKQPGDSFDIGSVSQEAVLGLLFALNTPKSFEKGQELLLKELADDGRIGTSPLNTIIEALKPREDVLVNLLAHEQPAVRAIALCAMGQDVEALSEPERNSLVERATDLVETATQIRSEAIRAAIATLWAKLGVTEGIPTLVSYLDDFYIDDDARETIAAAITHFDTYEMANAFLEMSEKTGEEEEADFNFDLALDDDLDLSFLESEGHPDELLDYLAIPLAEHREELTPRYPDLDTMLLSRLVRLAQGDTERTRAMALMALGEWADAPEAHREIERGINDTEEDIRKAALIGYAKLGGPDLDRYIARAFREEDEYFQRDILNAIIEKGGIELETVLIYGVGAADDDVQEVAIRAIPEGCQNPHLVDALGELSTSSWPHLQVDALEALGRCVPDERVVRVALSFLAKQDDEVFRAALGLLQNVGLEECIPVILDNWQTQGELSRRLLSFLAASNPAPLKDKRFRNNLSQMLEHWTESADPEVVAEAVLVASHYHFKEFVPLAIKLLRDSESKSLAYTALEAFDANHIVDDLMLELEKPEAADASNLVVKILLEKLDLSTDAHRETLRRRIEEWIVDERECYVDEESALSLIEKALDTERVVELATKAGFVEYAVGYLEGQGQKLSLSRQAELYIQALTGTEVDAGGQTSALCWLTDHKDDLPKHLLQQAIAIARPLIGDLQFQETDEQQRTLAAVSLMGELETILPMLQDMLPTILFGEEPLDVQFIFDLLDQIGCQEKLMWADNLAMFDDTQHRILRLKLLAGCLEELDLDRIQRFDAQYLACANAFSSMDETSQRVFVVLSLELNTDSAFDFTTMLIMSEDDDVLQWRRMVSSALGNEIHLPLLSRLVDLLPNYEGLQKLTILSLVQEGAEQLSNDERSKVFDALFDVIPILETTDDELDDARHKIADLLKEYRSPAFYPYIVKGLWHSDYFVSRACEELFTEIDPADYLNLVIDEFEHNVTGDAKLVQKSVEILTNNRSALSPEQIALLRRIAVPLVRHIDQAELMFSGINLNTLKTFLACLDGVYNIILALPTDRLAGLSNDMRPQVDDPELLIARLNLESSTLDVDFETLKQLIEIDSSEAAQVLASQFEETTEQTGVIRGLAHKQIPAYSAGLLCFTPSVVAPTTRMKALEVWQRSLSSVIPDYRIAAAQALGNLPIPDRITQLESLFQDLNSDVRAAAVQAIVQIEDVQNVHLIEPLLNDYALLLEMSGTEFINDELIELKAVKDIARFALAQMQAQNEPG